MEAAPHRRLAPHTFPGFRPDVRRQRPAVTTTHMKNGALRRGNGVPQSDQATLGGFSSGMAIT
jgi:hypothetical protein